MDWTESMVNETKIVNHREGRIHSWNWRYFIKKKNSERDIPEDFCALNTIKKKVKI